MGNIDWDNMLGDSFVKLEDATPKVMTLNNWVPQQQFKDDGGAIRPGISFDVLEEDGVMLDVQKKKNWTVTAKGALGQLKPIIEKAEAAGQTNVYVTVIRMGENRDTKYSIKEAPQSAPAPVQAPQAPPAPGAGVAQ